MADPDISISESKDPEFEAFLKNCIREFNNRTSELFRNVRRGPEAPRPINIILRDSGGRAIGGLSASTYWGWLDIEDFYIPDIYRGRGLGTAILREAESIARNRGCTAAQLTTYEFQARSFYERHGWKTVGRLDGYPPGSTYWWMRKDLDSSGL